LKAGRDLAGYELRDVAIEPEWESATKQIRLEFSLSRERKVETTWCALLAALDDLFRAPRTHATSRESLVIEGALSVPGNMGRITIVATGRTVRRHLARAGVTRKMATVVNPRTHRKPPLPAYARMGSRRAVGVRS
jgi:hypothetical protein